MPDDSPAASTPRQRYASPERRALPREPKIPSKVIGWARLRAGSTRHRLRGTEWYCVVERHPVPTALANHGYPLPGYVWLDVHGRAMHCPEADLEIQHTDRHAGK